MSEYINLADRFKNQFINKASQIYPNNDYSDIRYVKKNNITYALNIKCKLHKNFDIGSNNHIGKQKQNCSFCFPIGDKTKIKITVLLEKSGLIFKDEFKELLESYSLKCKLYNSCKLCGLLNHNTHNNPEIIDPEYCDNCVKQNSTNIINVLSKKCIISGCRNDSVFGYKEDMNRIMCQSHGKLFNLVSIQEQIISNKNINSVNNKLIKNPGSCKFDDCTTRSSYNEPNKKGNIYCSKHKYLLNNPTHAKDKKFISCSNKECTEYGNFTFDGVKPSINTMCFCIDHRINGYYNYLSDSCKLCNKQASRGILEKDKYVNLWCDGCSKKLKQDNPDMDIIIKPSVQRNQKCNIDKCTSSATFGIDKPEVCYKHNINKYPSYYGKNRICDTIECIQRATNINNSTNKKYCNTCSLLYDDLEKIVGTQKSDKRTNILNTDDATRIKNIYLIKNSIETLNKKYKCLGQECFKTPSYSDKADGMPKYCKLHATKGMKYSSRSILCKKCNQIYTNKVYNYICFKCLNPDTTIRNKEFLVVDKLKKFYPNLINNKEIIGGTSKYRPDIYISFENYELIIEIDEYQHTLYNDEFNRMEDILIDLDPTKKKIIIRFNPDEYDKCEKSILDPPEFEKRFNVLIEMIETSLTLDNDLNILYLFYDNYE